MLADPTDTEQRWPGDFLLHPLCLAAIAVLVVNDRFIKQHWPGTVAGKLSDVAGMVFFPLLLVGLAEFAVWLFGSRRLASPKWFVTTAVVVGATFAATKTVSPIRTGDEWVLGQLRWLPPAAIRFMRGQSAGNATYPDVVPDASDLLCVPFVLVAVWIGTRYRRPPRAQVATDSE